MAEYLGDVSKINSDHAFQELFRLDDGRHVVVSTVGDLAERFASVDAASQAIAKMSNAFAGTALAGEETMAFEADERGEITDWTEIAVANGQGSREDVLEELGLLEAARSSHGASEESDGR